MMTFSDLTNKLRQWDNQSNLWFSKNFSILFFEIILAVIFFFFINHTMDIFAISAQVHKDNITEQLLISQAGLTLLIVLLLIFNSFIMLYLFNNTLKMRGILKDLDHTMSRRRKESRDEE